MSTRALASTVVSLLGVLAADVAVAFHDRGVAACAGCHVMHESEDGRRVAAGDQLIRDFSSTDLCLSCHAESSGAVFGADPLSPPPERGPGNFVFLLEDNLNDADDGAMQPIPGDRAGHNVVSLAWGVSVDSRHSVAPGGSYPSSQLGCTSCHDPHGGSGYRMLWGAGPIRDGEFTFAFPAPQARPLPNRAVETPSSHVAYLDGWADWCGNCHDTRFHDTGTPSFAHRVDRAVGATIAGEYGRYDGETNPVGGSPAVAYRPEVPFEDSRVTPASTQGPSGASRVTCITCHRAHATSAPSATRWDPTVVHLDDDGLVSGSWPIPNPYPGPEQRSLCIQCHVSTTRDHGLERACLDCH